MADSAFFCEAEYQGYKGTSVSWRVEDGLQPSSGWIVLSLEDLNGLDLLPRSIPWRAAAGTEFDGNADIRAWEKLMSKSTVSDDSPHPSKPPGAGLNGSGDLTLLTRAYPSGNIIEEVTYNDVYVDIGSGEDTEGLAEVTDHNKGLIKIPLVSVEKYYANYGGFFGRINCRRKSGKWDLETVKDNGQPWSLLEVTRFLFSQLPGTPLVHSKSDIFTMKSLDAPNGVEGRGEPAADHLQKLLDRHGFKAQRQPNGHYAVNRKFSTNLARFKVATSVGEQKSVEDILSYERLTATPVDRPPAMVGVGPRRVQRVSTPCVPVLQNPDDHLYYRMEEVVSSFGYTMPQLNRQVFVTGELQFSDVDPAVTDEESAVLHWKRRDALKGAYKLYLPSFLFPDPKVGVDLEDEDLDLYPFLPMVDAPWYLSQLKGIRVYTGAKKGEPGDDGPWTLVAPVVRAQMVKQGFFPNFNDLEARFKAQSAIIDEQIAWETATLASYTELAKKSAEGLLESEQLSAHVLDKAAADEFGVHAKYSMSNGADRKLGAAVGVVFNEKSITKVTVTSMSISARLGIYSLMAKDQEKRLADLTIAKARIDGKFEKFKELYKDKANIYGRFNGGWGVLKPGTVSVDRASGLVKSGVPLCLIERPVFFDGDDQTVFMDGAVSVTYGVELKGSSALAYTNYAFAADDGDDPDRIAEVVFTGCHRSTAIKAKTFPIESREYILENGAPVNFTACFSEALTKATAQMALPRRVKGWTMELHGLRKAVLDAGAHTVHYEWGGDDATTYVSVNAPGALMPRAPAAWGPKRPQYQSDIREVQQREGS